MYALRPPYYDRRIAMRNAPFDKTAEMQLQRRLSRHRMQQKQHSYHELQAKRKRIAWVNTISNAKPTTTGGSTSGKVIGITSKECNTTHFTAVHIQ